MEQYQPDRRRHKRIAVNKSVLESDDFVALDLSESGMQLSCSSEHRQGRRIDMTLHLDDQVLTLTAEVIWCKRASSVFETGYHLGVQFVGYSVSEQLALRDYVAKYS